MNYIVTKNREHFEKIGEYQYCSLQDMVLPKYIAVDTETTGLEPQKDDDLFCIQIGTGKNNYLIDLQTYPNLSEDIVIKFKDVVPFLEDKVMCFHNACLPEDTEVLTINGWKNIKNVQLTDKIFGYDNGIIKQQDILSLISNKSEIWELYNTGRNFRSTPDHRWLIKNIKDNSVSYKETQKIDFKYDRIILNGKYTSPNKLNITDEELKIFTWAITDGHIAKSKGKRPTDCLFKQIVITQSLKKESYVNEIRDTLIKSNMSFREWEVPMKGYKSCKRFGLNAKNTKYLLDKIGYYDNFNFCEFVLKLSNEQLEIFIDVFNKAEGHAKPGMNYMISQSKEKNKNKRDGISLALYLKGLTVSFHKSNITGKKRIIADTRTLKIRKESKQDVYCLMTELSNFVVRQKECIFITGNCFDLKFFFKHNFFPKERILDTYIASKILYNGDEEVFKHDFGSVMLNELNVYYDKTEQKNINKVKLTQPSVITYCFNDVDKLLECHRVLYRKMQDYNCTKTYDLHCDYAKALAYMEMCGLPICERSWRQKMEVDRLNSKKAQESIIEYIWEHIPKFRDNQLSLFDTNKKIKLDLASPKQMIPVFKELKINIEVEEKGVVKESIEEDVIKKSDHEFVKLWLSYKEAEHRVTTFGERIISKIYKGRLYSSFNIMVDTGRISTRKGEINFLNFPSDKETRDCFRANKEFKIVGADYAAQEAVMSADLTGDAVMVASVIDNLDLHCAFARVLFPELAGLTDEEIKKNHKNKRNLAKAPRFCFQFGGSAFSLANNLGISLEEAIKFEKGFKELHAGIYKWGEEECKKSIERGYVENGDGFKLKLPEFKKFQKLNKWFNSLDNSFWENYRVGKQEAIAYKEALEKKEIYKIQFQNEFEFYKKYRPDISTYFSLKSQYFRLSLNNACQGKSAHQSKKANVLIYNWIVENNLQWVVRLANFIHDEIILEVKESFAKEASLALEKAMKDAGNYYLTNPLLKVSAEANIGDSWFGVK